MNVPNTLQKLAKILAGIALAIGLVLVGRWSAQSEGSETTGWPAVLWPVSVRAAVSG